VLLPQPGRHRLLDGAYKQDAVGSMMSSFMHVRDHPSALETQAQNDCDKIPRILSYWRVVYYWRKHLERKYRARSV